MTERRISPPLLWTLALLPASIVGEFSISHGIALLLLAVIAWFISPAARTVCLGVAGGYLAYWGGCGLEGGGSPMVGIASLLAATFVIAAKERASRLAALVVGAAGLAMSAALVSSVLQSVDHRAEANMLLHMGVGLAMAALAIAAAVVSRPSESNQRALVVMLTIAVTVGMGRVWLGADVSFGLARGSAAPHGRQFKAAASAACQTGDLAVMHQLQPVGADVAYWWVARGLHDNLPPGRLAGACPRFRKRLGLRGPCEQQIQLGQRVCQQLAQWPERAAQRLSSEADPALQRLQGDLFAVAGDLDLATQAYMRAASHGDPFSLRNAVRLFLDRGRPVPDGLVQEANDDPWVRYWLGMEQSVPEAWRAYNEILDMSRRLAAPERHGIMPVAAPGATRSAYSARREHSMVSFSSRYSSGFAVALPLPPENRVPEKLHFLARNRRELSLEIADHRGSRVLYTCNPSARSHDSRSVQRLPDKMCRGEWEEAVLKLQGELETPLTSMILRGELHWGRLRAEPPLEVELLP